ncbi:MAG TPA: hypothetical protein VGM27_16110, partial [Acidobacteriaceae bacterium]
RKSGEAVALTEAAAAREPQAETASNREVAAAIISGGPTPSSQVPAEGALKDPEIGAPGPMDSTTPPPQIEPALSQTPPGAPAPIAPRKQWKPKG